MDEDRSIEETISQALSAIDLGQLQALRTENQGNPLLLEVERIISWLELFNVLLNGLVRLNGLLEKSHVCQQKLAYLIRKSREKKHQLMSSTQKEQSTQQQTPESNHERSRSLSKSCDETGRENVDSLADRVASLLQVTGMTERRRPPRATKKKVVKTKSPETEQNSSISMTESTPKIIKPKPSKVLEAKQRNNNPSTQPKLPSPLDATPVNNERKSVERKSQALIHDLSKTNERTIDLSTKSSKLSSWYVEFPKEQKLPGKQKVRICKDSPKRLQEVFEENCERFKEKSEKRAELINTKSMVRKMTAETRLKQAIVDCILQNQEKERRIQNGNRWSADTCHDYSTARNGIKMKRLFTHKQMRDQTERIYHKLPEVIEKEREKKKEENRRTHLAMKQVFNHQLKRSISRGQLNFPITSNFIAY